MRAILRLSSFVFRPSSFVLDPCSRLSPSAIAAPCGACPSPRSPRSTGRSSATSRPFAAAGAPGIGIAIRKLEAIGLERAVALVRGAGLAVSCLTSSGLFPLGDEAGEREALARTRRHLAAAAALGADA